ncbi:formyltetrahydrofolate deformylase [Steroidobacter flavus]|uniref:Formyltetrahydrofolate deformylase n=1 Tax=Steroidobacter flavus TaxID=1842136 RepID=A0ABV8T2P6_9GAMM
MMTPQQPSYILTLSCPDGVGIVAAVTNDLAQHGALLTEAQHFREPVSNSSILRIVFESGSAAPLDIERLKQDFEAVAGRFRMSWSIRAASLRQRVLVAVSKQGHCLKSMLHRWEVGTLPVDIVGVVSNHETQRRLVEWHGLPFHYLPMEPEGKAAQERRMLQLFRDSSADLLVLARYMQILSSDLCRELAGKAINIHHSFLPGFKGAQPYHQAYARGVKLIGATSHYVTDDLDEGPIIEQAVERVDHTMTPEQLTTLGNEIESVVLNRAVQWHAEHRIFEFGNRTVILR